ncbi:MAG TPA: acyl-CoA dehydrogenase family protein, partial [Nocardioides sp.]|nr:acyl-CoA dehydrogenase family protein [Nocardioides sp.]
MDFTFTPEQDEAAALAASILEDRATNDRLKAVEAAGDRFDRDLWAELGSAGLLGLALPEEHDGAGLGLLELCRVLVEVGRTVAPVPLAAHGPASRLLAELGSDDLRGRWLPAAASGAAVLTAAVAEERAYAPSRPTTAAAPEGDGYRITGSKAIVPAGPYADAFLVPAETPTGVGVFVVEPGDPGVTVVAQTFSDRDAVARLDLDGVALGAERLVGSPDGSADHRLRQLLLLAACAEQLGITEGALRLTASYAKTREQFGRPIGTFQAVSQRLADGYI